VCFRSCQADKLAEAAKYLNLAEESSRKLAKATKPRPNSPFLPGMEMEVLNADAVILLGITHALRFAIGISVLQLTNFSESYMGYLQCVYV
jgi:hypothetical protein